MLFVLHKNIFNLIETNATLAKLVDKRYKFFKVDIYIFKRNNWEIMGIMQLSHYIEEIRRWAWFVMVVAITSVITVGTLSYFFINKVYEATATIMISTPIMESENGKQTYSDVPSDANLIKVYSTLIQSDTVMEQTINKLKLKTNIAVLRSEVLIESFEDTGFIKVIVRNGLPKQAQSIANYLVKSLQQKSDIIKLAGTVNTIDAAKLPTKPVKPNPMLNMFIAAVAGIMAGIILVLLFECMNYKVKNLHDLEKVSSLPIIATIPKFYKSRFKIRKVGYEESIVKNGEEAYKILRSKINSLCMLNQLKVILVTSPCASEGKTFTAINLAVSLAQLSKKVLLIDCNLRNPVLHTKLNQIDKRGLSDYLVGECETSFETCFIPHYNLHAVVSGPIPENPSELLESPKMSTFIKLARDNYDVIIIDCPPILPVADTCILSRLVDGVLLVVNYRNTTYEFVEKAMETLYNSAANTLGIVVNRMPISKKITIIK